MTAEAEIIRDKRRIQAAPGGGHDRLIRFLTWFLPVMIGVLAALMVLAPLSPRGEISFLLDRDRVALTENRQALERAMYRGSDNRGRPFSVLAGNAVQRSSRVPEVEMDDLTARILLSGGPAKLTATEGLYHLDEQRLDFEGPVNFEAADGYRMVARGVSVSLDDKRMVGDGRVEGRIPAGTFSADRLVADLQQRTISLIGNARLRMEPGAMRMP